MRRRSALTIVEMLVTMALIVFVLTILVTAFSEGMKTFRGLKGVGDMNRRLRIAETLLENDLKADHFEGRKRLSDTRFWDAPPRNGFFRIWQGSVIQPVGGSGPYVDEGTDTDFTVQSARATDHMLHFTVKRRGNDPKDFFRASVPLNSPLVTYGKYNSRFQDQPITNTSGNFSSQWAEVAWFLRPNGNTAKGTPLYTLYRRQRVIVPNPNNGDPTQDLNYGNTVPATAYNDLTGATGGTYLDVSCRQRGGKIYFNTPADLTVPQYRWGMNPAQDGGWPTTLDPTTGQLTYPRFQGLGVPGADPVEEQANPSLEGADVVITDVVSFMVRHRINSGDFIPNLPPSIDANGVAVNPLFSNIGGPFVFDTWTDLKDEQVDYTLWNNVSNTATLVLPANMQATRRPLGASTYVIGALQITIRVWDEKTQQSRQLTVTVDM